ncbi:MAG: hypothetical protein ACYS67_19360 [Planctomycetota bacterium]|jgi:hypothetical protein
MCEDVEFRVVQHLQERTATKDDIEHTIKEMTETMSRACTELMMLVKDMVKIDKKENRKAVLHEIHGIMKKTGFYSGNL